MGEYYYTSPTTVEESLTIMNQAEHKICIAAGCTNLMPCLKSKKIPDCVLMDISGLKDLRGICSDDKTIRIGALTTIHELQHSDEIEHSAAALWQACQRFADPLVRNRATLGGNLANASPAADSVVPLLVLDASVTVESIGAGKKEIPIESFFVAPGKSVLGPNELITAVSFPNDPGMKSCFIKSGLRQAMAISIINIGVAVKLEGSTIADIRIALGAVAPVAIRAKQTENYLIGKTISAEVLEHAAELVKSEINPITDIRASKEYRTHMAGILLRRAIEAVVA